MELICPSCEARYQLPDGAIGEKGRQVSCMSCGHGWHAFPPLVLGKSERTSTSSSGSIGIPFGAAGGGRPGEPVLPPRQQPGIEDEVASTSGIPDKPAASRTEQLAEIREMLAEVQAEDKAITGAGAADGGISVDEPEMSAGDTGGPSPLRQSSAGDAGHAEPDHADARDRFAEDEDASAQRQVHKADKAKEVDVKALRRKHDRKEKARKREKAAGTGAFLTGFLLVVIVAAIMIGLYVLHPAIINKMPGTEAALTEYVATVDSFRVSVAETFEQARNWLTGG